MRHQAPTFRSPHPRVAQRRQAALRSLGSVPFTRQQALAAGLTPSDLRSEAVQTVLTGVYAASALPLTLKLRCQAAQLVLPEGGRIAGVSAAALLDHPVPPHDAITVSLPHHSRLSRAGILVRHHDPSKGGVMRVQTHSGAPPISVSAPEQLLAECASTLSLVDGITLADSLLTRYPKRQQLWLQRWRDHPHARVKEVAHLARPGVESAMETRTRLLAVFSGAPEPVVQHEVLLSRRWRFDLAWPQYHVAAEYDGSYHYATEAQKQHDLMRADELSRAGWEIVRVVSVGIFRDPASTVRRLHAALRARGCRIGERHEWRRHFAQVAPEGQVA